MSSRALGPDETGKFVQYRLDREGNTPAKLRAANLNSNQRWDIWCKRVKSIMRSEWVEGRNLDVGDTFLNIWTEMYPHDAVSWYKPADGLLQSVVQVPGMCQLNNHTATWINVYLRPLPKKKPSYLAASQQVPPWRRH